MKCKHVREKLLKVGYYRGILKQKERKQLLSQGRENSACFFLLEHPRLKKQSSLFLYIIHPRENSDSVRNIKVQIFHRCATNTWDAEPIAGMKQQIIFTELENLVNFYVNFHSVSNFCECANFYALRQGDSPESLFTQSAFILRSVFYNDRDRVKPIMPRSLFKQVFVQPLSLELVP
jgi:hypothetical protein